jgi:hypothetical protein
MTRGWKIFRNEELEIYAHLKILLRHEIKETDGRGI